MKFIKSDKRISSEVITLAIPIIFSNLSRVIMGLTDMAMVSRLGVVALAATGMGSLLLWVVMSMGTPGVSVTLLDCVSVRGYHPTIITLEDVRVSSGQILGVEGGGFDVANEWLYAGRVMLGASCAGRAERVLDMCLDWAASRKQFGQTIGKFQGVSFKLADMAMETRAAWLLSLECAWKLDQGTMTRMDASMVNLFASEMIGRVTDNAVQIFGGMGLMSELPIERFWRDARVERIWEGTSEIHRHVISRDLLRDRER